MALNPKEIRYPASFWMTIGALVLTAFLTVALHTALVWLSIINPALIGGLRFVAHSEVDGWLARRKW